MFSDIQWDMDSDGERIVLGRGAFGTVYAGRLHGQQVAIKHETLMPGPHVAAWYKAVEVHMRAKCPYIAVMQGAVVRRINAGSGGTAYYSVMERLAGTLTAMVLTPGGAHYGADAVLRLQLLVDAAMGLEYLHSQSVIHADVKPDNVLLTPPAPARRPSAKLADFGSSVLRLADAKTRGTLAGARGTVVYMDPRLYDPAAGITSASDVYSFGVMAWQVLSGLTPYEAEMIATLPPTASPTQKEDALRKHVVGGGRPPVVALTERGVPPSVVALVQACFAPAASDRPSMAAVRIILEAAAAAAAGAGAPATLLPPPVVLRGHDVHVNSVVALPGGTLLASGDCAGCVRLWDVSGGGGEAAAAGVLDGHGGEVCCLAALPGGRRLAAGVWAKDSAPRSGCIVMWDTAPPTRRATIDCGSGVYALAVLRDGRRLAAGCGDGVVRLVDPDSGGGGAGAVVASLEGHAYAAAALAVLPGGVLASGSDDNKVRLWDVDARSCVATLAGHDNWVRALAVLGDGRLASGSWDKSVRLWDVAARTCVGVLTGHTFWVTALAPLSDGRLASGSDDLTVRVWDTRPAARPGGAVPAAVVVLEGHTRSVTALATLSDGRLASASGDGSVRLWRVPG